jgi:hypothetical protein
MPPFSSRWSAVAAVAVASIVLATILDRSAATPSADVSRGSEDAFTRSGLHPRELPARQSPRRWTADRTVFRFRNLPPGPATLIVALHAHRQSVSVAAGGAILGVLDPGATEGRYAIVAGRTLEVELRTEGFPAADARRLGAQLDRVALETTAASLPAPGLVLALLIPALAFVFLATGQGVAPQWAAVLAIGAAGVQCLLLLPSGAARSDYATTLGVELLIGAVAAALFARWMRARGESAAAWAFGALVSAIVVQGIIATSPLMIVSDAVFHAHKLAAVAKGDLFPTSVTQHAVPFRIPYGVSFYALLAPLVRAGFDAICLVRAGAAVSGIVASAALFAVVARHRSPAQAALATVVLQLLPGTFDVYSYGNLSNVFGQSMTVLFFAWWAGRALGGPLAGAALLALACTAHLSSLILSVAVVAALAIARHRDLRGDRVRLAALAIGFVVAAAYYARFLGLILDQIPRLAEGGGQGRGASQGALGALTLQLLGALGQWGIPATLLALFGAPRPGRSPWERDLAAYGFACLALFVPAILSPLDVRYLYALTMVVAAAAAEGGLVLTQRGRIGSLVAGVLALWQGVVAVRGILEGLLTRYR